MFAQVAAIIKSQYSGGANPKVSMEKDFNPEHISKIIEDAKISKEQKACLKFCIPYVFEPEKLEKEIRQVSEAHRS